MTAQNHFTSPTLEEAMAITVPSYFQLPEINTIQGNFSNNKNIGSKMDAILMEASGNLISTSQLFGKAMGVMGGSCTPPIHISLSRENRKRKIDSITSPDELKNYIAVFARVIGGDNETVVSDILAQFDGMEMPSPKRRKENPSADTMTHERNEEDFLIAPSVSDVMQIDMVHGLPTLAKLPPDMEKKKTITTKMDALIQIAAQGDRDNLYQFGKAMNKMASGMPSKPYLPVGKSERQKQIRSLHTSQELQPYVAVFVRALAGSDEKLIKDMLDAFDGMPLSKQKTTSKLDTTKELSTECETLEVPSLDDVMDIPLPPYMKKRLHVTIPDSAKDADTITEKMEALFLANKDEYQSHDRYNELSRDVAKAMSPPLRLASTRNVRYGAINDITSSAEVKPHIASFVRTIARDDRNVAQDILALFEGITLPSKAMVANNKNPIKEKPDSATTPDDAAIEGETRAAQLLRSLGLE